MPEISEIDYQIRKTSKDKEDATAVVL